MDLLQFSEGSLAFENPFHVLNFMPNSLLVFRDSTCINMVNLYHTFEPLSETTQQRQPIKCLVTADDSANQADWIFVCFFMQGLARD